MEPVSQAFLDSMLFSVGMNENDSYYHLPTKASPNPKLAASAKKKSPHKNYGTRDSLSQRYQLGKPGSRNYRQWESEFRLRKSHSESESSLSETEDADYDETYEPAYGMFAQFFVDGQVCERLAPFLSISEAEQEKLAPAPKHKPKERKKKEFDRSNAHAAFDHISVRSRKFLLKNYDNPLVGEIDEVINTFLRDSEAGVLDLDMETSYDRFLVHAMCYYYTLNSRSYNKKGKRVVVAKKKQTVYPVVPLALFLLELGRERVELNEDWDLSEGTEGEYDL